MSTIPHKRFACQYGRRQDASALRRFLELDRHSPRPRMLTQPYPQATDSALLGYLWYTSGEPSRTFDLELHAQPHHLAPDNDQAVRDRKRPLMQHMGAILVGDAAISIAEGITPIVCDEVE
jgi:hypothetical protein